MPLNPKDADILRQPFGTLIPDNQVTRQKVISILEGAKRVIAVGDATTERLVSFGITPDVAVIDGRERRSRRNYPSNYAARELQCTNPPGAISKEAIKVLQEVLKTPAPVRMLVDGEEDMLALPLFVMSPEGSVVLYGQPLEGLVVVKITRERQKQAKDLMDRICDDINLLDASDKHDSSSVLRKGQRGRNKPSK